MGLEFIGRTLRTTGIVLLITLPFSLYYFGLWPTLSFLSGGVWGILNLWLITHLVRFTIKPGGVDKRRAIGVAIYKFPVLYLSGYFMLRIDQFNPLILIAGTLLVLAIIVLKSVGRLMLGLDVSQPDSNSLQGVK